MKEGLDIRQEVGAATIEVREQFTRHSKSEKSLSEIKLFVEITLIFLTKDINLLQNYYAYSIAKEIAEITLVKYVYC